jgi:Flp pilus assembly protein TadD
LTGQIDAQVRRALAFHGAEKLAEAAALYDEILAVVPDRGDILHLRGICAFQDGQCGRAEAAIRRAIALAPAEPDYHNSLSIVLAEGRAFANAVAAAEQALRLAPGHDGYRLTLADALYGAGRPDDATKAYRTVLAARPGDAKILSALAGIAFDRGDDATAQTLFARAAEADPDYAWARCCVAGDTLDRWSDPAAADGALQGFPDLSGEMPSADPARPLVFSACDAAYLERYAVALARSVDRHAPGHDIYLHVMARAEDVDARLDALRRTLSGAHLTVTRETPPAGADAVYFSNMRFARLWQIGVVGIRTVLALDADSLVRGPLSPGAGAPAAAPLRPWIPHLNRRMLATSVLFRPDPRAAALLGAVAAHILSAMTGGASAWYLDQCAFAVAARRLERETGAPVLGDLDRRYADDRMSDRAAVWSAKGMRKENERYMAEAARLAA